MNIFYLQYILKKTNLNFYLKCKNKKKEREYIQIQVNFVWICCKDAKKVTSNYLSFI